MKKKIIIWLLAIIFLFSVIYFLASQIPVDCPRQHYLVTNTNTGECSAYDGCDEKRKFEEYGCDLTREQIIEVLKEESELLSDCQAICNLEGASYCFHSFSYSGDSYFCPEVYDCDWRNCNLTEVQEFRENPTY